MKLEQICVCCGDDCVESKKFNSYKELIKWAEEHDNIKVGDIVKVIDTSKEYNSLSTETFYNLYVNWIYDIGELLQIVSKLNREDLGYSSGVCEINDSYFKVLSIFENNNKKVSFNNKYVLLESFDNKIKYHYYYILSMEGVKKCVI